MGQDRRGFLRLRRRRQRQDHNPETAAKLSDVLRVNPNVPYEQRIQTARFIEDLTAATMGCSAPGQPAMMDLPLPRKR